MNEVPMHNLGLKALFHEPKADQFPKGNDFNLRQLFKGKKIKNVYLEIGLIKKPHFP